jgi:Na+/H+-dicarboxylate symporter
LKTLVIVRGVSVLGVVVGLTLEGVGIMAVIDTFADVIRTAINVSGDDACTVLLMRILGYKLQR